MRDAAGVDRGSGERRRFDLLVTGRPSVDVMFSGLPTWPALGEDIESAGVGVCAGTSFNTPAAANRLGLSVAFVTILGNDPWSGMIRDEFDVEGLPTDFLDVVDRPLPGISVSMNLDGDRGFVTHWGSDETYGDLLRERAHDAVERIDARHLHAYVDEDPELASAARLRGMTVSLDAWGGPAWSSTRPLDELLADADILLANETEATAMTGAADPGQAMGRLAQHCACVVITRGAAGAIGMTGGRRCAVPADPADVVDATGAGDCFNAGFLRGWLGGLDLEASLALGVICGGRAMNDYGGYRGCPWEPELAAIAASRGIDLPPAHMQGSTTS
jgi:sugar/nucleoside kinase (ribokinase family)